VRLTARFEPLPHALEADVFRQLEGRFGLPRSALAAHRLWHRVGTPTVWIASAGVEPPRGPRVEALGLVLMREPPPGGKPTNVFMQRFGHHATRNVYALDDHQAHAFVEGHAVEIAACDDGRGWAVARWGSVVLGRAFWRDGLLESQLKKSWRADLTVPG
jgi:hypothetical protein